jgi:poly-gamma-glutamate synthesis protein (capsule biosynthesis protein)
MLVQLGCAKVQALSAFHPAEKKENPSYIVDKGESKELEEQINKIIMINETLVASVKGTANLEQKTVEDTKEVVENSSAILMFTGDLMCLGGQQNAVNKSNEFDFSHSFSFVAPLFQGADIVIGNLETLISPSNPYSYKKKTKDNNPNCNAMESYLEALVSSGFDAVVTANNHSLDGGTVGVMETITKLEEYKLVHTGTFTSDKEQPFILYEVNGITIAILSYTELINARSSLPTKKVESLISCYSKDKVISDVIAAKQCSADYIVAYNHWGTENSHVVTKLQKQHATEMAEAGVDLIIGSHPHCLQEAAYISTSDGRQVLCVYSMGNFVSSMTREINSDTIVLEVNLRRNHETVYPGAIGYYPMKVIGSYQKMRYVILPVAPQLNGYSDLDIKLEQARERIRKVIGTEISEIRF